MCQFSDVVFDLDGTLIDSRTGILESFRIVLLEMGVEPQSDADLSFVIGPPLRDSFRSLLSTNDNDRVESAVRMYHQHFGSVGIHKNSIYPGVREVLEYLHLIGIRIHLATAKEEQYPPIILAQHSIGGLFDSTYGASIDGIGSTKREIIAKLISAEQLDVRFGAMVGDRAEDVTGARDNGLFAVGAAYGFGSIDELRKSNPQRLVHSPTEILDALGMRAN